MKPNDKRLLNLRPIKPGEVRNPHGRKRKADCLISCIKAELDSKSLNGQTKEQMIASMLVGLAEKGNLKAIDLLMEYTIMKPAQALNLGGQTDNPVAVKIIEVVRPNAT